MHDGIFYPVSPLTGRLLLTEDEFNEEKNAFTEWLKEREDKEHAEDREKIQAEYDAKRKEYEAGTTNTPL